MTETELQKGVIECAELTGWGVYHVHNVKGQLRSRTAVGFQDLNLVHGHRALLVYAELKDRYRKPTQEQVEWGQRVALAARHCPTHVYACLWRPQIYDEVIHFLTGETNAPPGRVRL